MKKYFDEPRLALIFLIGVIVVAISIAVFSPAKADNMSYYEKQHLELIREQNRQLERIARSLEYMERKR